MNNVKKISTILLTGAIMTTAMPVSALTKNETVYSKLNNDGSVKKTVVSEYLKNTDDKINDVTNLKNILNLNGTEKYKLEGTNLVWDAAGKDIYYQGETEETLPVSLEITYQLDGKDIKLDDLLGKKGNVTINLKYTNNDSHLVNVNGKNTKLYTPFVVTTGTIISNDNNSNITVTNGKVISNGKNSVVVGITSPGLYESLDAESLKNFDTVTINFDTNNFELSSIYSAVSSKLISNDDLKIFNKLDGIYSKVDKLSASSKQLVEGSNKLKEGTNLLNNTLSSKIKELENTEAIDSNKLAYIKKTAGEKAVTTVEENADSIKQKGAMGVDKYISTLESIINSAETKNPMLTVLYENNLCELDPAQVPEQYTQALAYCQVPEVQQYLKVKKMYATLQNEELQAVLKNIAGEVAYGTAEQTAQQTAETTSTEVAKQVADTAKTTTVESLKTLNSNIATLTDGVNTLANGISKFDSEGISKIAYLVNGDVKTTEGKVKALINLGNAYDSFTMKADNTEGETKFVLVVDGAKKVVKNDTKKVTKTTKKSVLDKIKDLF